MNYFHRHREQRRAISARPRKTREGCDIVREYHGPVAVEELYDALRRAHGTSAGPDENHYRLLKKTKKTKKQHLKNPLCYFFSISLIKSGFFSDFPSDWRKAFVIHIPKPGKDLINPTNYRPIALTSSVCKTTERIINRRLVWCLESHNFLTDVQYRFRSRRSTVDHVRFETLCRESFIHNQHLVFVFFDLEKAYTTWKYGIMKDP